MPEPVRIHLDSDGVRSSTECPGAQHAEPLDALEEIARSGLDLSVFLREGCICVAAYGPSGIPGKTAFVCGMGASLGDAIAEMRGGALRLKAISMVPPPA